MRTRIVGLSVLSAVLAIALFGLPLAVIVGKYLLDDERGELERVAALGAVSVSVNLARGQLPHGMPTSDAREVAVYNAAGARIIGQGPPLAEGATAKSRSQNRIERSTHDHGDIAVAVPVATGTSVLGVVRAATPRAKTYTQIGWVWGFMFGLATIAVLAVALLARRMAAKLARPLEDLAHSADALGDGDFTARFPAAGIPEIDSVADALNSTAARLHNLVARERAFSADASHQLRTPLTALRLGLEVALDDPHQDPRKAITTAVAGTDRLQKTVEDLLALARDSSRAREPLALGVLLDELAHTWRPQLAARRRALNIITAPDLPVSGASTAAVRQILAVLLDNAATHGSGTVTVTARDAGAALGIDVADQGPPITVSPARLFSRRAPSATGHGIGLALARSLAEAEAGRLRLSQPAPPTFTLLVPPMDEPRHRHHGDHGEARLPAR